MTCFFVLTRAGISKHKHLTTHFMHIFLSNQDNLFMALNNGTLLVLVSCAIHPADIYKVSSGRCTVETAEC